MIYLFTNMKRIKHKSPIINFGYLAFLLHKFLQEFEALYLVDQFEMHQDQMPGALTLEIMHQDLKALDSPHQWRARRDQMCGALTLGVMQLIHFACPVVKRQGQQFLQNLPEHCQLLRLIIYC